MLVNSDKEQVHRAGWRAVLIRHVPPEQFGRYLLVGMWNTVIGYGLFAALTAILDPVLPHGYMVASAVAALLNITLAYLGYKWFVFKTKGNYLREWSRSVLVYSGAIAINLGLLPIFVYAIRHATRFDTAAPYLAGALLTGVTVLWNFFGHRNFSFHRPE